MMRRVTGSVVLLGCILLASGLMAGQAGSRPASWTVPRTPDGQPDLQGVWANNNGTPLERPKQYAGKTHLTDAELADLKARVAKVLDGGDAIFFDDLVAAALSDDKSLRSFDQQTGNYDQSWLVERVFDHRTSLVVDPPDGRIPPLTREAQQRLAARAAERRLHPADRPEDLSLNTRCITYGVPNFIAGYNSYYEIVQAPGYVVIRMEMIHDARVIPLDGRAHVGSSIRQWHGDSRGHWEGTTLVVDTTNYSPKSNFRGSSETLHVIERFTRVDASTLEYAITIDDPTTWTKPWTAMIPLRKTEEQVFEYACHEGNIGMAAILSGARAEEKAALGGR